MTNTNYPPGITNEDIDAQFGDAEREQKLEWEADQDKLENTTDWKAEQVYKVEEKIENENNI